MRKILQVDQVDWEEWRHNETIRVHFKPLHDEEGAHMGVCVQKLSPGCKTSPAHFHMKEEEHVFVLKGRMTLRLGQEHQEMGPGDYVCFPAGEKTEHCLSNPNETPCEYLLWGERKADEVVVYPDSNKVNVRELGEIYRRKPLDYWDGEEAEPQGSRKDD